MSGYCKVAPGHEWHGPYHDEEYGVPRREDSKLFELLVMEMLHLDLPAAQVAKHGGRIFGLAVRGHERPERSGFRLPVDLHFGEVEAQARVSIRNIRRDGVELLRRREKDADISQDQQRKLQQDVQHLTDDYVKRIDEALAQKDREILQV